MIKISIVILNFNCEKFILDCLASVQKAKEKSDFEVETVVIDNGSIDNSVNLIKKNFPEMTILETHENLGFAEGNNVGIRYALQNDADYVLILNPDTLVDEHLLTFLMKAAKSDSQKGVLGPKIYFAPGFEFHKDRYRKDEIGKVIYYAGGKIDWQNMIASHRGVDEVDRGQFDQEMETDFVTGCCMLVRREVFDKIGPFDKKYFLYLEDNDFCQRAKRAGFRLVYVPKAKMFHLDSASSAVGGLLQDYFITRNRLLFGLKYAGLRAKFALFRESLKLLFAGREWQKIAIRDFYIKRFGPGSYIRKTK